MTRTGVLTSLLVGTLAAAACAGTKGTAADAATTDASANDGAAVTDAPDATSGAEVTDAPDTTAVADVADVPDAIAAVEVADAPDATAAVEAGDASVQEAVGDVADAADEGPEVDAGPAPLGLPLCGKAPHTWLPREDVGAVVTWEEAAFTDFTPDAVDGLLADAGYGALTPVTYGVRNFYLRYVTQDRGVLREATAVVGVPVGVDPGGAQPVMLWLHGTSGYADGCAPSAHPLEGVVPTTLISSRGYITVAPDYLGMLGFGEPSSPGTVHPYLVGEPTAIACWDALRAALAALAAAGDLPAGDPDQVLVMGGSQGGHAGFFVERYAPYYAPEFGLRAVAAAVPVTDILDHAVYASGVWSATATTFAPMLAAMRRWYGAPPDLTGVLTDLHLN